MTIINFLKENLQKFYCRCKTVRQAKTKFKQTAILNSSFYNIVISKRASHGHYASQKVNKSLSV